MQTTTKKERPIIRILQKVQQSLPIQLLLVIGFALLFSDYFSIPVLRFFYTLSLLFREMLSLLLPFIVFSFILAGIVSLKKNAPLILFTLLGCIVASNISAAFVAYFFGWIALPYLTKGVVIDTNLSERVLTPYGIIPYIEGVMQKLQSWISGVPVFSWFFPLRSEKAMLAAIVLGIFFALCLAWIPKSKRLLGVIEQYILRFKSVIERVLKQGFIPFLPLYVFGFLLELNYRQAGWGLFEYYGRTLVFILCLHLFYLLIMYFFAARFSIAGTIRAIKNSFPSYITALSTMSSTATIPVTVQVGARNTGNRPLAEVAVPILSNVHLVGDCISTPLLALVTVYLFLGKTVGVATYAIFVFYFCQTMLAVSGIPGGGIIVMIPILESIFHFNPAMVSLITTLYLLQDAFGTAANVMGDGALMMIVDNILKWCKIKKSEN